MKPCRPSEPMGSPTRCTEKKKKNGLGRPAEDGGATPGSGSGLEVRRFERGRRDPYQDAPVWGCLFIAPLAVTRTTTPVGGPGGC